MKVDQYKVIGPSFNTNLYTHTFIPLHVYTSVTHDSFHLFCFIRSLWALRFFFRQLQHLKEEGITLLGPQMKTGAYGEPSSAERWPCLLVQVGLRLFTPSLTDELEEGSGTKTVQATLGRGMLRQC